MVYRGVVTNGVVILEGGVRLPEGTAVAVETVETGNDTAGDDSIYRIWQIAVPTGLPDLALNLDHYLYGHPRVDDVGGQ
jgi:hypothetical protein